MQEDICQEERGSVSPLQGNAEGCSDCNSDEATAYTDPENEAILQNSIAKLVAGKTLIVIAHRLSTVKDSDQIFVVNDGKVTAHGTHEELLMSCPLYKEMWDAHISVKDTVKEGE